MTQIGCYYLSNCYVHYGFDIILSPQRIRILDISKIRTIWISFCPRQSPHYYPTFILTRAKRNHIHSSLKMQVSLPMNMFTKPMRGILKSSTLRPPFLPPLSSESTSLLASLFGKPIFTWQAPIFYWHKRCKKRGLTVLLEQLCCSNHYLKKNPNAKICKNHE